MRNIKNIAILAIAILCGTFLYGCSTNDDDIYLKVDKIYVDIIQPKYVGTDSIIEAVDDEQTTRASTTNSGMIFTFWYEHGDTLGIFPEGGYQIPFELPIAAGEKKTSTPISATGWMTKVGVYYVSYLPFDFYNRYYSKIPWDYRGQRQSANGNRDHLATKLFMASDTCTVDSGRFHATLRCKGTMVVLKCMNWPNEGAGKFKKVLLASSKSGQFVTHGYFDLFDVKKEINASGEEVHASDSQPLRPADDGASDYITFYLSSVQINAGKQFQGWVMINPTNVTNEVLTIYCWREDGVCVSGSTIITDETAGDMRENSAYTILFDNMQVIATPAVYVNEYREVIGLSGTALD